jgi:tetratricopeptide (TPR) repeat protein
LIDTDDKKLHQLAWRSFKEEDFKGAWRQAKVLFERSPGFAPVWDIASRVAQAVGNGQMALDLIDRALTIEADNFAFLTQKAYCLLTLQRGREAQQILDGLSDSALRLAAEYDTLGNLYSMCKDQRQALLYFDKAIELEPGKAHFYLNVALVKQSLGDVEGAESAFDKVIELNPRDHEAWLHRSRLRKQTTADNHTENMEALIAGGKETWRREMTIRYALAKEYEDLGEYQSSFHNLKIGSSLRRDHMQHDAHTDLNTIDTIINHFTKDYLDQPHRGFESEEPMFIVGLPRTGTTLVERIIGSHSEVYAAGELNNFAQNLTRKITASGLKKPVNREQFVEAATRVNYERLGQAYVESTRPHTGKTARFIDKLPLNFLYCGLILKALPNAKIIHLTRHPMDTCFAIYKTLFKQAYPFSYDLQELGQYYLAYQKLMQHWQSSLPGRILDVSYEKLVTNQEEESRRIISFCGMEWQDACLNFHKNRAPSMTASLSQVRQPVYTTSIGRWQNYREDLRPLEVMFEREGLKF